MNFFSGKTKEGHDFFVKEFATNRKRLETLKDEIAKAEPAERAAFVSSLTTFANTIVSDRKNGLSKEDRQGITKFVRDLASAEDRKSSSAFADVFASVRHEPMAEGKRNRVSPYLTGVLVLLGVASWYVAYKIYQGEQTFLYDLGPLVEGKMAAIEAAAKGIIEKNYNGLFVGPDSESQIGTLKTALALAKKYSGGIVEYSVEFPQNLPLDRPSNVTNLGAATFSFELNGAAFRATADMTVTNASNWKTLFESGLAAAASTSSSFFEDKMALLVNEIFKVTAVFATAFAAAVISLNNRKTLDFWSSFYGAVFITLTGASLLSILVKGLCLTLAFDQFVQFGYAAFEFCKGQVLDYIEGKATGVALGVINGAVSGIAGKILESVVTVKTGLMPGATAAVGIGMMCALTSGFVTYSKTRTDLSLQFTETAFAIATSVAVWIAQMVLKPVASYTYSAAVALLSNLTGASRQAKGATELLNTDFRNLVRKFKLDVLKIEPAQLPSAAAPEGLMLKSLPIVEGNNFSREAGLEWARRRKAEMALRMASGDINAAAELLLAE
jgi:hypothetical protein